MRSGAMNTGPCSVSSFIYSSVLHANKINSTTIKNRKVGYYLFYLLKKKVMRQVYRTTKIVYNHNLLQIYHLFICLCRLLVRDTVSKWYGRFFLTCRLLGKILPPWPVNTDIMQFVAPNVNK